MMGDLIPKGGSKCGCTGHSRGDVAQTSSAIDPVCGMEVDPATAKHRAEHDGQTYYFCSARCRERFLADPARYSAKAGAKGATVSRSCCGATPTDDHRARNMHAHSHGVQKHEHGSTTTTAGAHLVKDPVRNMDVEPATAKHRAEHNGNTSRLGQQVSNWLQLILATPVVLWAGWPLFVRDGMLTQAESAAVDSRGNAADLSQPAI